MVCRRSSGCVCVRARDEHHGQAAESRDRDKHGRNRWATRDVHPGIRSRTCASRGPHETGCRQIRFRHAGLDTAHRLTAESPVGRQWPRARGDIWSPAKCPAQCPATCPATRVHQGRARGVSNERSSREERQTRPVATRLRTPRKRRTRRGARQRVKCFAAYGPV